MNWEDTKKSMGKQGSGVGEGKWKSTKCFVKNTIMASNAL